MAVTVSRKLNIVLPPFETKEGLAYIHSVPVGRSTFEGCFRPMAKTMSLIISDNIGPIGGPSIASLMLQREADAIGEGSSISNGLMPELRRLTNVGIPGKDGYSFSTACERGLIDPDQALEVENILVYFTLVSWIRVPDGLSSGMGLEGLRQLWNVQTTSLELTAYMSSLKTSTPVENIGAKTPIPTTSPFSTAA